MSNTEQSTSSGLASTAVVWAIVVLFVCTVFASSMVAVFADGDTAVTLIAALFTNLGLIVAVVANLRATQQVQRDTADLRNGLLDAKVRAGVADVLPDHMVDPDYRATGQYRRDDERRAQEG